MSVAAPGDQVKIHYTGKFENGEVFDSSVQREEPFEFIVGASQVIPGMEKAVIGMEPGDKKSVTMPPEEAYGEPRQELVATIPRDRLPEDLKPEVGQVLQVPAEGGGELAVAVTEVTEETIRIDGNYPLAGKTLVFDIELLEITDSLREE